MLFESIQNTINKFDVKNALVGFSGGVDSTVLVYILSKFENLNVRAVYVNHGLSDNADEWENFCKQFCLENNVEFISRKVDCSNLNGDSLEALAREKRYNVYQELLEDNEYLCLGQHSDDQVETVLLQLFRGTGLSGLSGMPLCSQFKNGFILRPFLDNSTLTISKNIIEEYSNKNNISHIFDESNNSNAFRRNYLRNEIIPKIEKEFGKIDKAVMRTANNCAEAQEYINYKVLDLKSNSFCISALNNLCKFEIKNTIQKWIKNNGFQPLSSGKLKELLKIIKSYKTDSNFEINTKKYYIKHFNYNLYIIDKNKQSKTINQLNINRIEGDSILYKKDIDKSFIYKGKYFNLKKYIRNNKIPIWLRSSLVFHVKNKDILAVYNLN